MALTKIVATLGPASEKKETILELINSGASIFRFNLKHNLPSWHESLALKVRDVSNEIKKPIAILFDLPRENFKMPLSKIFNYFFKNFSKRLKKEIDFVAISFVQNQKEIEELKKHFRKISFEAKILAKIENINGVKNFEKILDIADGIMIARGDLGKKISFEKVPYFQKVIIKRCLEKGKPVITATEMLKSMVENPYPTRAEISDVANAILDYSDALMLSEETAVGKYPSKAVKVMEKISSFWERARPACDLNFEILHQTSAICYSAYQLWRSPFCQREEVKAFLVLTRTGMSARALSRLRPTIPIFAFTNNEKVYHQLLLSFGIFPVFFPEKNFYKKRDSNDIKRILFKLKTIARLKKGERIIFLFAEDWGILGRTNILRIQEIP